MKSLGGQPGFSLMEVLIGMFLTTVLMSGIIHLLAESVSAYRLQLSQSHLEESSRYAYDVLTSHISQAGYQPQPWRKDMHLTALTDETQNGDSLHGDQLGLQRWSVHNCYGNENPITDAEGLPKFYLLQTRFKVNASNNLTITCRYGPDASRLKTQINNYGLVEDVESMQVLFAEDQDGDSIPDQWVTGQSWSEEGKILAARVGLLFSTHQAVMQTSERQFSLLDQNFTRPADGRLRKKKTFTSAIRGRLR